MHVVLICTSVIVQLHSVLSTTVENITDRCLNHETIHFTLTSDQEADCKIVEITTKQQLNCTIDYFVMDDNYIMGVLEFPLWYLVEKICIAEEVSAVTVSNFNESKKCVIKKAQPRFSVANQSSLHVNLQDLTNISSLRIIATSMRVRGLYKCSSDHEVECVHKQKVYCLRKKFSCDGIANCGVPNFYDEDLQKCSGLGVTHFMIFCTLLMHIMSLLLIISLCFTLTPKRKETFVYKFDHSMPLFDSDDGNVTYDIDVEIMYPKELELKTFKPVK